MKKTSLAILMAALALVFAGAAFAAPLPGGTLDPLLIPKYVDQLVIPPSMPQSPAAVPGIDYYEIAVRQFQQNILPASMGLPTTVWSYASKTNPAPVAQGGTLHYPAFTIEAAYNKPVRVKWMNELVDANGDYLSHILPVDPTLHWANPPGGATGRDTRPSFAATPGRYTGPVPIVTHVHGAHVADDSDGFTEAWFLPAANNIPTDFATTGTFYDVFKPKAEARIGQTWDPGSAVFQYSNDQRATTLWYHDHTLGMTRLNVYAGPAGFYLLRGAGNAAADDLDLGYNPPGPTLGQGVNPGTITEIPIAIQDRSFDNDGSLFFPASRAFFEGLNLFPTAPYLDIPFIGAQACTGESDISPIWNPESFGNTMVVNGKTWPNLKVEQRRYRLRFLNGCNSRFLILRLVTASDINKPGTWKEVPLPFAQIGSEGGFLPKTATQNELLIGLAERADTVIDFANFPVGSFVYLINVGPDEPFGGGIPGRDFPVSDPGTTGQVMRFEITARTVAKDPTTPAGKLQLPTISPINAQGAFARPLSLNELDSATVLASADRAGNVFMACNDPAALPFGPREAQLGVMDAGNNPLALPWMEAITENPALGGTEVWEIYNFTADAHPIHLHQVMFQVVNRQSLVVDKAGMTVAPATLLGAPILPMPWETGFKDTVISYPGQVTRIKATFDLPGLYVWHCHIVDHEDNEMMRPYFVGDPTGYPVSLMMP